MKKRLVKDHCDGFQTTFYLGYILDDGSIRSLQVYIDDNLKKYDEDYVITDNSIIEFNNAPPEGSYVYIGGEFLVIKESKLVAIYEFTNEDLQNSDPILLDLPERLDKQENLIVVSYNGRLEYEKEYEVDIENQIITLTIEPVPGEIIQLFYYVIT